MADQRMSLKEMCARFDVTPRTLRYYEYIELLQPEKEGRSRFYTARDMARMKLILRGRRWGFSLEEIRQWLQIYDRQGNAAQMAEWIRLADRQLTTLRAEQDQLARTILELEETRNQIAADIAAPPDNP